MLKRRTYARLATVFAVIAILAFGYCGLGPDPNIPDGRFAKIIWSAIVVVISILLSFAFFIGYAIKKSLQD